MHRAEDVTNTAAQLQHHIRMVATPTEQCLAYHQFYVHSKHHCVKVTAVMWHVRNGKSYF